MAKRYFNGKKQCSKCSDVLELTEFYNRSDKPHLLESHCKKCIATTSKAYILANSEWKKLRDKKYHNANRDKRIGYLKEYHQKNKLRKAEYLRNKYHTDPNFKLQQNLRNRIRMALKRQSKGAKTMELIGCTVEALRLHIELLFKPGMSWANYGAWQVDHILPCSRFDLSVVANQFKCFHYTNLQPLWEPENRAKSNKIEMEVCYR